MRVRVLALGTNALRVVAATSMLFAQGCVTVRPISPGQAVELAPNQGILVVHLSTNTPIKRLTFGFGGEIVDLPAGEHVAVFVTSSGNFSWRKIELPGAIRPRFYMHRAEKQRFSVESGRISYSGMLQLQREHGWRLWFRTVDRSAVAVGMLRERYPKLMERYPIVYTGTGRNVFLEHHRAALREGPRPASNRSEEGTTQP